MNVAILNKSTSAGGSTYLELACGNKSAFIGFPCFGGVDVCVNNAAHRVWRGAGRWFGSMGDALAAYKSGEVRAMIEAAYAAKHGGAS